MSLIVTGGIILEETVPFTPPPSSVTLPIVETWTVADNPAGVSGDYPWVGFLGPLGWVVSGNTALLTGQGFSTIGARLNVDVGTDAYAVTATYPLWSPDTSGFLIGGPILRAQGTTDITFYTAVLISGTPTYLYLYRFLSGAQTVLGSPVIVTPHTNMTVSIRGVGNIISVAFDGTQVIGPISDANIPTGRYAGIQGVAPGLNAVKFDNVAVTNWPVGGGGDVTPPTVAITTPTSSPTYATDTTPLTISGTALDDTAVASVSWSNNRGGSGIASGTTSWTVSGIVLQPGDNVLTVLAQDTSTNISTPDTLTVTYTPVVSPVASPGDDAGGQLMIIQNTTFERKVRLKDTSGLAVTGATLGITLAKGAGAFTAITPTVTEQGTGWYNLSLTAAHNDTIGSHTLYITAPGAVPRELFDQVVAAEVPDPWAIALPAAYGAGTAGALVGSNLWEQAASAHNTAGTMGAKLNTASASADPWSSLIPGTYGAGTAGAVLGNLLTAALTESYAADGQPASVSQILYMILQSLTDKSVVSNTMTVKRLNGTTAMVFSLNSPTTPTSITRIA